MW
ncbi:Protein of unknown function [Bacillus cereus]|jgi:hypothetical protein